MDETLFGEAVNGSSEMRQKEHGTCESITSMDCDTKHHCQNPDKAQELCESIMECDDRS